MTEQDLAVIARIGGNLYRERIAGKSWPSHDDPNTWMYNGSPMSSMDKWIRDDAESLATGESYRRGQYSQPFTRSDGSVDAAYFHEMSHYMSKRPDMRAKLPEAAFDWPIYRAGIGLASAIGWPTGREMPRGWPSWVTRG